MFFSFNEQGNAQDIKANLLPLCLCSDFQVKRKQMNSTRKYFAANTTVHFPCKTSALFLGRTQFSSLLMFYIAIKTPDHMAWDFGMVYELWMLGTPSMSSVLQNLILPPSQNKCLELSINLY